MVVGKDKTKKEFEELLLEVRKVTRVTTGGRRMSFRATVLVGDKKGKIGLGLSKGVDVTSAVKKAANEAYKNMFNVPITKVKSVPYAIVNKYKACSVKIIPAAQGTGLKAGSSVRSVLELAGYENILSKRIGSNNKLNNAIATINGLIKYKHADYFTASKNNKNIEEISSLDKEDENIEKVLKKEETKESNNIEKIKVEKKTMNKTPLSNEKPVVKKSPIKKTTKDSTIKKTIIKSPTKK